MNHQARFVLITGLSGAGKTQTLRCFEDHGYFCVDNLPAALVPTFAELVARADAPHQHVAVCVDARTGEDLINLPEYLEHVAELGFGAETLYLETHEDVLHQRYSESRRPHPSSPTGSIKEGIRHERKLLDPIREQADIVIDTTQTTSAELNERIAKLALHHGGKTRMTVGVISFGYKHGLPKEADLVFDVRFLPNPHYDAVLRPRDGREDPVRDFVLGNDSGRAFLAQAQTFLEFVMPRYEEEPKSYLTLGIGCTGGRHRSVAVAEQVAAYLEDAGYDVTIRHRDVDRDPGD